MPFLQKILYLFKGSLTLIIAHYIEEKLGGWEFLRDYTNMLHFITYVMLVNQDRVNTIIPINVILSSGLLQKNL